VFVTAANLRASIDPERPHTGRSSLKLEGNKGTLTVKLSSLLGARPFPGDWALAGAYFFCDRPAQVSISCDIKGQSMVRGQATLLPGQWTAVFVDLTRL